MLHKSTICDHDYLKKENCTNILILEPIHLKDKSDKCSICDLSFSRIDILERHANFFHEDKISKNML